MARRVKKFPRRGKKGKRIGKYEQYLDGKVWELEPGVDFETDSLAAFRSNLYTSAKRMGLKVLTSVVDGKLYIQAEDRFSLDDTSPTDYEGDVDFGAADEPQEEQPPATTQTQEEAIP